MVRSIFCPHDCVWREVSSPARRRWGCMKIRMSVLEAISIQHFLMINSDIKSMIKKIIKYNSYSIILINNINIYQKIILERKVEETLAFHKHYPSFMQRKFCTKILGHFDIITHFFNSIA